MKNLVLELGFNPKLMDELENLSDKNRRKAEICAEQCRKKGFHILSRENDLMRLAVCLKYAEYTKQQYEKIAVSDDIFYNTMKDIVIWCENNNNRGLKNYRWIENHLKCELFRIGRLQYQISKINSRKLDYRHLPLNYGDNVIYVHIPQGEKLIYSDCVNSLKEARAFFEEKFSSFEYQFFFSESWLLFEDNRLFMEPSSNILHFQSLFKIAVNIKNENQAIERIFGKKQIFKSKYPENTSLQKNAKKFICSGGKLGIGIGIINKNDI